jgi:hypothetical protein
MTAITTFLRTYPRVGKFLCTLALISSGVRRLSAGSPIVVDVQAGNPQSQIDTLSPPPRVDTITGIALSPAGAV